jgi:hypothetical protein
MPSQEYSKLVPFFCEVFQSGVEPYSQPTALPVCRLVTGRQFDDIQPYFGTDLHYRGTYPGASGIFTSERPDLTSAEVLGTLGFESAPSPSFLLNYDFSGKAIYLDRITHSGFLEQFLAVTGADRHTFSQDVRYYLESEKLVTETDAIVWPSPSGDALGISGSTYLILPPYSGALHAKNFDKIV